MREELRQDEYELLARLAQRYYVDERTQEELAAEFALSRPKVQRLLERARRSGVVAIHIQAPPWLRLELESQLRETFGLSDAIVCSARRRPGGASARPSPSARPATWSAASTTAAWWR